MLIPPIGAFVKHKQTGIFGSVYAIDSTDTPKLSVHWQDQRLPKIVSLSDIQNALTPGYEVEDIPSQTFYKSYGIGKVKQLRTVGNQEQVLVDFWESNQRLWLPWQNLKPVSGVEASFSRGRKPKLGSAENLRLRNLAYALEEWHDNTGSLSKLPIDPLPHQIHLVNRIKSSGNYNWIIADDVGLGKTIEVGMLLSSLKQQKFKRFLIVTPAGLTLQWQEEMRDKFELGDFQIYGKDFNINQINHWLSYNYVIASIDTLKSEHHLEKIQASGNWDIIIFDEAHRLTRSQYGRRFNASERFRLAATLRDKTENMLLLTGTPHQGKTDRFKALLELIRPGDEWRKRIMLLDKNLSLLQNMIIRNRKADVTDADGNFIFQGKETRTSQVIINEVEKAFDIALHNYLKEGYNVSKSGGNTTQAIGFVMTIYRKLAASSIKAISSALQRRLLRLQEPEEQDSKERWEDERFVETEERINTRKQEFFRGELGMIQDLINQAKLIMKNDSKLKHFMYDIIKPILNGSPEEKILIFTEYRSTQDYLVHALGQHYGKCKVSVIHGGQNLQDRLEAMQHFEEKGQFLISTEAGGEGLNLQRNCHIMVNYDLPWNPMRLVQRVGRLYRYGQSKPVVVINMQMANTIDNNIIQLMYERLEQVASDMAEVNDEYREGLKEDILGELVSNLDVESLLEEAINHDVQRSKERLEEALERARQAAELENDILQYATGYKKDDLADDLKLNTEHLKAFILGMTKQLNIEISEELYDGRVWVLRIPEDFQSILATKTSLRICFDKILSSRLKNTELITVDSKLFQFFLEQAKQFHFGGQTAVISQQEGRFNFSAVLRWQNERGYPQRKEYINLSFDTEGNIKLNSDKWSDWLLKEARDSDSQVIQKSTERLKKIHKVIHEQLDKKSNTDSYPDDYLAISAAWIG